MIHSQFVKIAAINKRLVLVAFAYFALSQAVPTGFSATQPSGTGIQAELNQPQPSLAQKDFLTGTSLASRAKQTPSTIPLIDFLENSTLSAPSPKTEAQTPAIPETPDPVPPPSVTPPPETVSIKTLTIGGTKAPGQSLWISSNGGESYSLFVAENTETTWSASVSLVNGANNFKIVAANTLLYTSTEVNVPTILYSYTIATPTVTPPPATILNNPWIVLSGMKAAGQSIWVSSNKGRSYTQLVPKNTATVWSAQVPLANAANDFTILAKDAFGNSSAVVAVPSITYALAAPAVATPPEAIASHTVTLSGSKASGTSLWISSDGGQSYTQLVANDSSTTWKALVSVARGNNHFVVFAEDLAGNSSALVSISNIRCTSVTPAPGNQAALFIQGPTD